MHDGSTRIARPLSYMRMNRHQVHAHCGWASLPPMYIGMCLAGRYLSAAVSPLFGVWLAMHWTVFMGMAAGHLLEFLVVKVISTFRPLKPGLIVTQKINAVE